MERFNPNPGGTYAYTANGVSQNFALPPGNGLFLRLQNSGANPAYAELGSDANLPAAIPTGNTVGGFPVYSNQPPFIVMMSPGDTRIALISAGASTVQVTRGEIV